VQRNRDTPTRRNPTPRISVVIPTRNEARNLEVVLPRIAALRPAVHEIIIVDGRSTDDTVDTARRVLPHVRIVHQTRHGKGNAMACGFAAATGDVLVMLDADGSADPTEIPTFVNALLAGADFAKGSRFTTGGASHDITLLRRTGNAGLNHVANTLFGTRHTDLCYGYNAFWADLLPVLDLPDPHTHADTMVWGDGFEIETVLNCRVAAAGLTITEVPSVERRRLHGVTKLRTFADGTRVLRTLLAERRALRARGAARPTTWPATRPATQPATRPSGGPVAARETHDPAAHPAGHLPARGEHRPPGRTVAGPANRERYGVRYALEEGPS
jgi:hypothetical protein